MFFSGKYKIFLFVFVVSAPEILNGEMYGHAVDWWAIGVVACRMFTNEVSPKFLIAYLVNW